MDDYIDAHGWGDHEVVRQETGVLPITLAIENWPLDTPEIGIRGGFYHAITGYSFPDALNVANFISLSDLASDPNVAEDVDTTLVVMKSKHRETESFLRLLNRMLFRACEPDQRYKVLQRFYGLPIDLIERFYAGKLNQADKARILIGKPPVPVTKALYNFSEKAFIKRERVKRDKA